MRIKVSKFFSNLVLVDVLLLPFLRPLAITLTMIPVALWNLRNSKKILSEKRGIIGSTFLVFASLSLAFSFLIRPDIFNINGGTVYVWKNNVSQLAILILLISYYNFIKFNIIKHSINVYRYLEVYLIFNFILAIVYWINYITYFKIRGLWTLSGGSTEIGEFSSITRFTGIMSDPNNAAVAITAVFSFLCVYQSISFKRFIVYLLMCIFCLVSAMSSTGFIAFATALLFLVFKLSSGSVGNKFNINRFIFYTTGIFLSLAVGYAIIGTTEIGTTTLNRFSENSAESRFAKLDYLFDLDAVGKLFIGDGGTIFFNDQIFAPHIGHLHFLLNYGIISYFLFVLLVFGMNRKISTYYYLPLLVIFIGFTSNTGFIDFRFSMLTSILMAAYFSKKQKISSTLISTQKFISPPQ